jgi:hypothetical protein
VPKTPDPAGPEHSRLRVVLESTWVVGVLAYGLARTFVVWGALAGYGVNPWVYGLIDLVSSVPYAIGTARVVTGTIDRDWARVRKWGLIAAVAFIAPDLYILTAGHAMPAIVYVVLGTWVAAAALLAGRSVALKLRSARVMTGGASA